MAMYTKHVHPKIAHGVPYTRPARPATFIGIHEVSLTFDIHSADEEARVEYWEDTAGTLSAADVELAVYGAEGKAVWLTNNPPNML